MVTITSTIACLRCLPVRCHCRVLWVGCRLQEERPSPAPTNARDEWKLTAASKKAFSKGLWIRHVKGHSNHEWNNVADKLAGDGNFKRRTHCGPPWTLGPLVGGH